jgi:lipoprotein LprG
MQSRMAAVFAPILAVVVLVAGCTASDSPDPATLVSASAETTQALTGAHLELTVDGEIAELPIQAISGDLTQAPEVAAQGTLDVTYLGQQLVGVEFVIFDGALWVALTPGSDLVNFGPASAVYDVAAILDPDVGLANLLADFSDAKTDGSETIAGVETVRITGTVTSDAVNKLLPQLAAEDPVPGTVWISPDGDNELIQVRLEPSPGNTITMTLSKWGEPVTVENPAP